MQNRTLIIGVSTFVILVTSFILGFSMARGPVAGARPEYPEKAKALGQWIDEQSLLYQTKNVEMQAYFAKQNAAGMDMQKAEATANGYRKALCVEFNLIRKDGSFVEDATCVRDFQ